MYILCKDFLSAQKTILAHSEGLNVGVTVDTTSPTPSYLNVDVIKWKHQKLYAPLTVQNVGVLLGKMVLRICVMMIGMVAGKWDIHYANRVWKRNAPLNKDVYEYENDF